MKNIFIGGVAKSGKSTFAKIFSDKAKYNHIPLDYFASAFKHQLPLVGITSNVVIDYKSSETFANYLSRVVDIIECHDELFILDSAHIMPRDIVKYLDKNKWDIYYLGYSKTSKEEKFNLIRKYESGEDWTFKRSDDDLLNTVDKLISLSKEIEKECSDYNIKYIDTSFDFSEFNKYN